MAPPLGVEPRPSALQADALPLRQGGVSGCLRDIPRPQLCSCQTAKLLVPDPGVEPGFHGSGPCVLPLDESGSATARSSPVRAARTARSGAPGSRTPRVSRGRRVYSAPRLPYRSRAPDGAESEKATESSRWLLRASASRSTELREWSPPSGNDAAQLHGGALLAARPGPEPTAIAVEAREPGRRGRARPCFIVTEAHHDVVPGG